MSEHVPNGGIELILEEARALALETGGERAARGVSETASLERDVGLGSIERVELVTRIEQRTGATLPDKVLQAETCAEIAVALEEAPRRGPARPVSSESTALAPSLIPTGPKRLALTVDRALFARAEEAPDRVTVFLTEDDGSERDITYGELFNAAARIAAALSDRGISRGDTVALMLPTGFDFLSAFQGILLHGAVAVPIYPPVRLDRLTEYADRQSAILRSAGVKIMITVARAKVVAQILKSKVPTLLAVVTADELSENARGGSVSLQSKPEDPAFIQYTSGSTGSPKGVLLSHANLMANIKAIGLGLDARPVEVGVSWLPLYHDMGLIGSWLFTMASAYPLALRSPLSFLARPERWLHDIHKRRGTMTAAPNFAYELCVRRIRDEDIQGIDLSSWRCALNGAEPVRPETIDRFVRRFAPYGFRRETMMPVFGLAECSVGLAFPPVDRGPRFDRVDRASFEKGQATPAVANDPSANVFVSAGSTLPEHEIKVVNEAGETLPEREVGRLLFRGPSMTAGYYGNEEATAAIRRPGGFLDTGDLAYLAEGELFIAGRRKDLIIRGGRNLVAAEIEEAASEAEGVRKGCVAAFGVVDERSGTEQVVIVAETKAVAAAERDGIERRVIDLVANAVGSPPDVVRLVGPGSVPKTSSGKIRRNDTKALYLSGALGRERGDSLWARMRLAALLVRGAGSTAWSRASLALRGVRLFGALALYCPLSTVVLPFLRPHAARRFEHASAKVALRLLTPNASTSRRLKLEPDKPALIVSNHQGYLDVIILRALLPPDFVFVAKREAFEYPFVGRFLKKSGHIGVERKDARQSASDASSLTEALNRNERVLVFPEGTFTHVDGVRPFRLGAFRSASDAGCPIIPVAIRGARAILRDGQFIPRRGPVSLWIGEPVNPEGSTFRDLVALRDRTRALIAARSGEVLLDLVSAGWEES